MNKLLGVLLAASCLLAGCTSAPAPVQSMQDSQADFGSFKSFGWKNTEDTTYILDNDIRAAIASELKAKGYAEAAAGATPDILLHYETHAGEKAKQNKFRFGIGVGGAGSNGAVGVGTSTPSHSIVREGTLVLSVIDPHRNAEVWNGRVSREIASQGRPSPELIQSAVAELLKGFPGHGS